MLVIDGQSLGIDDVAAVARHQSQEQNYTQVEVSESCRATLAAVRKYLETHWISEDAGPMYGVNTGVGALKNCRIPVDAILEFQRLLINSHSAGVGEPLAEDIVRGSILLRINSFASGHSGVRPLLVDRLIRMLNTGIHPIIPEKGSVGASGDLAPLAYIAAAATGHSNAEVLLNGTKMSAEDAFISVGQEPHFTLQAKEGLAMINGTSVSSAIAALCCKDARDLIAHAEIALCLTMEASRAELSAFDARVQRARPHTGQIETAANVRRILIGSRRCGATTRTTSSTTKPDLDTQDVRVQDAYSIRCAPQIHGPVRDAQGYAERVVGVEINSAVDNPLIFPRSDASEEFELICGGNFHGQYIAQAMDLLAIAIADIGSVSERRAARLLDVNSGYGLPPNLVKEKPGLNTGYSIAQCTMSALVTENKTLCWPASVDSIPTKANQEDHVSNSTWCARKASTVIANTFNVIAIEILIASRALSFFEKSMGLGKGTAAAYETIRSVIPLSTAQDEWIHTSIVDILRLVKCGSLLQAVNSASQEST